MGISLAYAEKIMKNANSSDDMIKTSLQKLMNFLEKNNFSEKNDLKVIISKV